MSFTDPSPPAAPCPPHVAERLKAEAIARLRASRPAWRNEHSDRLHREREARRIAREFRQAQREAAQPVKVCVGCKQELPLSSYSTKGAGKFNSRCRPCHSAKVAAHKRAKRAALTPAELEAKRAAERAEYYSRTGREGETGLSLDERAEARLRKAAERAAEIASRMAERATERARSREREAAERAAVLALRLAERQSYATATEAERQAQAALREAAKAAERAEALARHLGKRKAKVAAKAERKRRKVAERAAYLIALLNGTDAGERINDAETWDRVTAELRTLWLKSGDKECVSCKETVPPTAIHPPGPANSYEGQCHSCADASYEANLARLGIAREGPRLLRLKDGSTITVAALARRHRERDRGRRFARNWR